MRNPKRSLPRNALVAVILLVTSAALTGQNPEDILLQARQLTEKGHYEEALRAFAQFRERRPADFRSYLYSGISLFRAGRPKDAGLELDDAAMLGLSGASHVLAYARVRDELGQAGEAVRALSEVETELDAEGLWYLAELFYRLKQAGKALPVLERFAAKKPGDSRLKLRRGQIFIDLERFEDALTSLEEAVWADPRSSEAHFEMARTLRYGNNLEAAKEIASKAVDLKPDNPEYLHLLGIICDGLRLGEEAVGYLRRASQSPRAFPRIYFDLGNALRKTGDTESSRQVLGRYRELYTAEETEANRAKTVAALINQGRLRIQANAVGEARSAFLRVVEAEPDNWVGHSFLAKIYLSSGAPHLARPHLEKMQQVDDQSAEGDYLMAYYLYQQRDHSRAVTYAERSRTWRPGDGELRNLLGNIYVNLGQREDALGEYSAAVKLVPDRFDFKANFQTLAKKLRP